MTASTDLLRPGEPETLNPFVAGSQRTGAEVRVCPVCRKAQPLGYYRAGIPECRPCWYAARDARVSRRADIDARREDVMRHGAIYKKMHRIMYQCVLGTLSEESVRKRTGACRDFLKLHIEKRFKEGMSWDNYGTVWVLGFKKRTPDYSSLYYENITPVFKKRGSSPVVMLE